LIHIKAGLRQPSASFDEGVRHMDASYYSVVERAQDGRFIAWVPDLPGISISGETEEEVIRALSQTIRQCVREMIVDGKPVPKARPIDELPRANAGRHLHRMLLVIG
jgi:predicted RNase H-like HicB family nuclease